MKTAERILLIVLAKCEKSEITDEKQCEAIEEIESELKQHAIEFVPFVVYEYDMGANVRDQDIEEMYNKWIIPKYDCDDCIYWPCVGLNEDGQKRLERGTCGDHTPK